MMRCIFVNIEEVFMPSEEAPKSIEEKSLKKH
jgi:hypothetical protein